MKLNWRRRGRDREKYGGGDEDNDDDKDEISKHPLKRAKIEDVVEKKEEDIEINDLVSIIVPVHNAVRSSRYAEIFTSKRIQTKSLILFYLLAYIDALDQRNI